MEAVGRLAGGVAHEFNNLLTAIHGNRELVRKDLAVEDPKRADIDEIVAATAEQRAASSGMELNRGVR
jgi:signal transduction histidine kinase